MKTGEIKISVAEFCDKCLQQCPSLLDHVCPAIVAPPGDNGGKLQQCAECQQTFDTSGQSLETGAKLAPRALVGQDHCWAFGGEA